MKIAKTLEYILDDPLVVRALDKTSDSISLLKDTGDLWSVDLDNRNPAPAYTYPSDGEAVYSGSDFDMFSFLMGLTRRKAILNIPNYKRFRSGAKSSQDTIVSEENRHGEITGFVSNQKTHSFSIRLMDYNVLTYGKDNKEKIGDHRNFGVVDVLGELYRGWEEIEFRPTTEEEKFLLENKLMEFEKLIFDNFIHPSLHKAFFGSRYLATKFVVSRVFDEAEVCRSRENYLREQGVRLSEGFSSNKPRYTPYSGEEFEKKKVRGIESELIFSASLKQGKYPILGIEQDGETFSYDFKDRREIHKQLDGKDLQRILRHNVWRSDQLSWGLGYLAKTPVRAVELAFYKHGFKRSRTSGEEHKPGWSIPRWNRNKLIKKGGKTRWDVLDFGNGINLAYRFRTNTQEVLASSPLNANFLSTFKKY